MAVILTNDDYQFEMVDEISRRINNAATGIKLGPVWDKALKIVITQLFIDGFITSVPDHGEPLPIAGSIHEVQINGSFNR